MRRSLSVLSCCVLRRCFSALLRDLSVGVGQAASHLRLVPLLSAAVPSLCAPSRGCLLFVEVVNDSAQVLKLSFCVFTRRVVSCHIVEGLLQIFAPAHTRLEHLAQKDGPSRACNAIGRAPRRRWDLLPCLAFLCGGTYLPVEGSDLVASLASVLRCGGAYFSVEGSGSFPSFSGFSLAFILTTIRLCRGERERPLRS